MAAERLFDLYWLAYLLTGDRERSAQAVIETLEMPDAANPFFAGWMTTWSRKIFLAKVLGCVIPESSVAEIRARYKRLRSEFGRAGARRIDPGAGKAELERALLAIDPLPRRALLLSVFEKLAIEDVGILLNADRETVKTATAIGLIELARNLAGPRKSEAISAAMASSIAPVQEMAI